MNSEKKVNRFYVFNSFTDAVFKTIIIKEKINEILYHKGNQRDFKR